MPEDINILEVLKNMSSDDIMKLSIAVVDNAQSLYQSWSIEEEALLIEKCNTCPTLEEVRQKHFPDRSLYSLQKKMRRLDLTRGSTWESNKDFDILSTTELSYIAGIIDGEGYIRCDSYPSIWVTNTCLDLINWLQSKLGGNVRSITKKEEHHKDAYAWVMSRKHNVVKLLQLIYPYLIVKKQKADMMFLKYNIVQGDGKK